MKTISIILVVLILAGGGYYWYSQRDGNPAPQNVEDSQSKINIDAVCEGALAYMSFPDGESAERFLVECKAGEHPEVIERYKSDMNLGDGAAI